MNISLGEKLEKYEKCYKLSIIDNLPIVLRIKIRNYKKVISNTKKPFDYDFYQVMSQTAMYVSSQLQDAVFTYYHNDEINIILSSSEDQDPWLNNDIQTMVSVVASQATSGFKHSIEIWGEDLKIPSNIVFEASAWGLPSVQEVVNYIVHRQDSAIKQAINRSCWFHLEERFGREKASDLFQNKSYDDKEDLVLSHCGVDIYEFYNSYYIFGLGLYKIREIQDSVPRNRWYMNKELPNFIEDKEFLSAILSNKADIFRASQILEK